MLTHLALWQRFHAPLVAFVATLILALAGRFLRIGLLAAAAGGAGLAAGWFLLTQRLWPVPGGPVVDQLGALAAITLLIALLCGWLARGRAWAGILLAAVAAAWLLAGSPRHLAALQASWPTTLAVAAAVLVFGRLLASNTPDPARLALAGLTLAAALDVVGAPTLWTQLALVPGLAALAVFASPSLSATAVLPLAAGIGALCCAVSVTLGGLSRLAFHPADAAAVSPLLALWLQPYAAGRCQKLGRAAELAGAVLAGAIAVVCVWVSRQAFGR